MRDEPKVRVLNLGGIADTQKRINLREVYGFVGYVSQEARDEIASNEARAGRVITTAAKFAFR